MELANALNWFPRLSPGLFAWLAKALASPHWRVRAAATQAFVRHHRHVPDVTIRRLYALRNDPESPCIRAQTDQALRQRCSSDALAMLSGALLRALARPGAPYPDSG